MALAEHLHPKTYWEERCELVEESVLRLMNILTAHLPYAAHSDLQAHATDWNRLIGELANKFPPPDAPSPSLKD
jgi:hypothetical protein